MRKFKQIKKIVTLICIFTKNYRTSLTTKINKSIYEQNNLLLLKFRVINPAGNLVLKIYLYLKFYFF